MEAVSRGARDAGAPAIGFNIRLPTEQEPNAFLTPDLTFNFHYFAMRKMHLAMRANALVVFPGGFGTLDELFEILTLHQSGKVTSVPIVLFDRTYWTKLINFELLVGEGMIDPADLTLFGFADDYEEIWRTLVGRGLREHTPETCTAGIRRTASILRAILAQRCLRPNTDGSLRGRPRIACRERAHSHSSARIDGMAEAA